MTSNAVRIKVENQDAGENIDVARERFASALHDLLSKDEEELDIENALEIDNKEKLSHDGDSLGSGSSRSGMLFSSNTRPMRKRRRKDMESRDAGFHHTFVMRMFDRSVDLAQFPESSPLYPICRAWMVNQPHTADHNVKQEPSSPCRVDSVDDGKIRSDDEDALPKVTSLPPPDSWPQSDESLAHDPRIPKPLPYTGKPLDHVNEESDASPSALLMQHLGRWRTIRTRWRAASQRADARYHKSHDILKAMFEREGEREWDQIIEKKSQEECCES